MSTWRIGVEHRRRCSVRPLRCPRASGRGRRAGGAGWRAGGTRAAPRPPARARPARRWRRARGRAGSRAPGRRRPGCRAPSRPEPGAGDQPGDLVGGEAAAGSGRSVPESSSELASACGEVAGHGPGDDGGVPLGDQQAEPATGAEHPWIAASAAAGSSTTSRTPWQSTTSALPGPTTSSRPDEIALQTGDLDTDLAGSAGEGRQGVGAGVDHGDPVAEPGHPDREAAGAAADVEDLEPGLVRTGARAWSRAIPTPRRCGRCRGVRWLT